MCTWRYPRSNWYLNEQQWRHGIDPVVFHHDSLSNVLQLDPAGHTSVIDDDVESFTVQRRLNSLHQTWVFRRVTYICSQSSTPYYNKQGTIQDLGRRRVHQEIWESEVPQYRQGATPGREPWGQCPQLLIFWKLCHSDILWKKAKRYFVKLALQTAVFGWLEVRGGLACTQWTPWICHWQVIRNK